MFQSREGGLGFGFDGGLNLGLTHCHSFILAIASNPFIMAYAPRSSLTVLFDCAGYDPIVEVHG